jgi:hypothetical protein
LRRNFIPFLTSAIRFVISLISLLLPFLKHARPGITGTYDQHDYFDEKRDALMQWGARLRSIVELAPVASNVVALRG